MKNAPSGNPAEALGMIAWLPGPFGGAAVAKKPAPHYLPSNKSFIRRVFSSQAWFKQGRPKPASSVLSSDKCVLNNTEHKQCAKHKA